MSTQKVSAVAFADPDPFQELEYPNVMAAKRAIADDLGMPLGKLSADQLAEINAIVGTTLDKKKVLEQVRHYFRQDRRKTKC